jgi:hypothetical protein
MGPSHSIFVDASGDLEGKQEWCIIAMYAIGEVWAWYERRYA